MPTNNNNNNNNNNNTIDDSNESTNVIPIVVGVSVAVVITNIVGKSITICTIRIMYADSKMIGPHPQLI